MPYDPKAGYDARNNAASLEGLRHLVSAVGRSWKWEKRKPDKIYRTGWMDRNIPGYGWVHRTRLEGWKRRGWVRVTYRNGEISTGRLTAEGVAALGL